jgi:signal transduction histidine kinase
MHDVNPESEKASPHQRILVIDDTPDIHANFRRILAPRDVDASSDLDLLTQEMLGSSSPETPHHPSFVVANALSGSEGVRLAKTEMEQGEPFAAAFVDMRMPGMDGLATIEALWQIDPRLQVVICTAFSDHSWQEITARLGTTDRLLILRKPFDPIEVLQLAMALSTKWRLARMEERQRQVDKLESLGRLAGGVAHDFNNVLAAILGYAELTQLDEHLDATTRARIQDILNATERGRQLTARLLAFARERPPQPQPADIDGVIEDMVALLRQLIGHGIELKTQLGSRPALVMADPPQIGQIFLNLAVNARDAMPRGGRMTITTSAGPDLLNKKPAVSIVVADNGTGMPPEVLRHIWEPFFTTKAPGKGTGMGLSVIRDAIRDMGGTITVDSRQGVGTSFHILLPQVSPQG